MDADWFVGPNAAGESRVTPEMRLHPTPRPTWLFEQFILRSTHPGDVVLDLMVGSGSSMVAARRLGRRFIGYDINPDYVELAAARVQRTVLDPARLDPATNGSLALREFLSWAFAHFREFWPTARGRRKPPIGRIGADFLAVWTGTLQQQLAKWGYDEAQVRPQWDRDGLLIHEKGKRTRLVRLGSRTRRCVVFRLE